MANDALNLPATTHDYHLPGILRLPPAIRRQIYEYLGLGRGPCHIAGTKPAFYHLADKTIVETVHGQFGVVKGFQSFHGLLLSCRTIYAEAAALLYSANRFIIRYRTRRSLEPLRALTPLALASLTTLTIVLSQASESPCEGECCAETLEDGAWTADPAMAESCSATHSCFYNPECESRLTEALLADWHATAAYLAPHIVPGQLELALVCDGYYEDVVAAQRVVDSLGLLPRLKNCHVRLCRTAHPRLQQLAQEAALKARGILSEPRPPLRSSRPRLLELPRELRLRMLGYTDLVTPWKEVTWNRNVRGYYIVRHPCSGIIGGDYCDLKLPYHPCHFVQCTRRTWWEPALGCFCRIRHAAFSSECRCWAPPTKLFLVCRALNADANLVLYSQNRFIIVDSPAVSPFSAWHTEDYPHGTFAATKFLLYVAPRRCLAHIRFLEIAFAPWTHLTRPRDDHAALQKWSETMHWARHTLNLPGLTLRLVVAGDTMHAVPSAEEMTKAGSAEVMTWYTRLLDPLRLLDPGTDGGLARFYAHLVWPLQWVASRRQMPMDLIDRKHHELKRRAEQFVMGEGYVPADEPEDSRWTLDVLLY